MDFHLFKLECVDSREIQKLSQLKSPPPFEIDYEDIGIAFDETKRYGVLNEYSRSILCENGITEDDARIYDIAHDILSPHYLYNNRDGCALCPHAKREERLRWFSDYPDAFDILIYLQNQVKINCPERLPLRGYKWFIDEDGNIN